MTTELSTIVNKLAANNTEFIAIPKPALDEEKIELLYYCLGDNRDEVASFMRGIDSVEVDGQSLPLIGWYNISHSNVHLDNRVPVYAEQISHLGLDEVPSAEGVRNVRDYLAGEVQRSTQTETVEAETLIKELANAGAVAVGLDKELFNISEDTLTFTVYMPPATGKELVSSYDSVRLDDDIYDLNCRFSIDGPAFKYKVGVYADDSIRGMSPLSIEEGLDILRHFIDREKNTVPQ